MQSLLHAFFSNLRRRSCRVELLQSFVHKALNHRQIATQKVTENKGFLYENHSGKLFSFSY